MIVVCMIAVFSGVAGISYFILKPTLQLGGATRQVLGDLAAARMAAVNDNNRYKIFFDANEREYRVLDDNNKDGVFDENAELVRTINIQDNYPDVTIRANSNPIFSPRGLANTYGTVVIQNSSGTKEVKISSAGRVRIQ